jgi:hypothetical protein
MQGGLSYSQQYQMAADLLSDADSANLVLIKNLISTGQTSVEAQLNIDYTVKTRDIILYTDAISGTSYRAYALPEDFRRMVEFYSTVSSTRYLGEQIFDEQLWQTINTTTAVNSSYLQLYFIRGSNRIEVYPVPSSAVTATMIYQARTKPLSANDYTTGTVTSVASGASAVIINGSTLTSAMVGRYFKTDDGLWYKISAVGSTTTLTLDSKYQGATIAAGTSSYTIAEFPLTPPDTHILPVYFACWKYSMMRKNLSMAREYESMFKEGIVSAQADYASSNSSRVLENKGRNWRGGINPNFYPGGMT